MMNRHDEANTLGVIGAMDRVSWREVTIQAVILVVALAAVFPGVFLHGDVIAPGDILFKTPPWDHYAPPDYDGFKNRTLIDYLTAFYPMYAISKTAIQNGEWPLWNPLELGGMPLLANYQSTVFYPLRLLHLAFDLPVAITLHILLKLWLCGLAAYLCARGIRLSAGAARLFSLGWMLCSYSLLWAYWPLSDITAWFPFLFLAVEWLLEARYRKGFYAFLASGVLMMLGGHPETVFTLGIGLGLYLLARLLLDGRRGRALWMPVAVCAAASTLILLVCAVQILPFIEYLANSYTLAWHNKFGDAFHWPVRAVASFWVPRYFLTSASNKLWGFPIPYYVQMMYIGIIPWFGIGLLLCKADRTWPHRRRVAALGLSLLPCLILPFCPPSLEWLRTRPPLQWIFPVYFSVFGLFALLLLGALGVERWFAQRRRARELVHTVTMLIPALLFLTVLYRFDRSLMHSAGIAREVWSALWIAAAIAGATWLILAGAKWRPRAAMAALAALLAADLIHAVHGMQVTSPRAYLYPKTALTDYLLALPQPARVTGDFAGIPAGILPCYGIEEQMGYEGMYPARIMTLQQTLKENVWKALEPMYAVGYYLNDARFEPMFPVDKPGYFDKTASMDGVDVYVNRRALPRAYLASELEALPDTAALFARLAREDWDPVRTVLTDVPPPRPFPSLSLRGGLPARRSNPPISDDASAPSAGSATVTQRSHTQLTVDVDARSEAVLVLSDAYYPGWRAWIDTNEETIFPVFHAFRGLIVPPGHHVVEFRYKPWTFRAGLGISTIALTTLVCIAAANLLRTDRKRRPSRAR